MARKRDNRAERLGRAIDALPQRTRAAMLEGIDRNRIIVGAYTHPGLGGICPMLAAHRNGGRTSVASFARAWDAFTGAKRPRRATRREIVALRSRLQLSLVRDAGAGESIAQLARQLRDERERLSCHPLAPAELANASTEQHAPAVSAPESPAPAAGADRHRASELRLRPRWSWLRPARRYDEFKDLLAAAEEQLSEQRAGELLGERAVEHLR